MMAPDALSRQADLSLAQAPAAPQVRTAATPAATAKAGKDFEAMFMTEMMKPMFDGIGTGGWFGGGQGEEMFRSVLIGAYGKLIADHGTGLGIGAAVSKTLLQAQEAKP